MKALWTMLPLALLIAGCEPAPQGTDTAPPPQRDQAEGEPEVYNTMGEGMWMPGDMEWQDGPASLEEGAEMAVLEGDPGELGAFVIRLRVPDGFRVNPHWHPRTERVTVISGTFLLGMGSEFDEDELMRFPAGSYAYWEPEMHHFAQAEGETTIQLHGIGPWEIHYINPGDDPRLRE